MTDPNRGRARLRALAWTSIALGLVIAAALAIASYRGARPLPSRPEAERPPLHLVTSLPLLFAETLSLESAGSPALTALESRYRVVPVGIADRSSLEDARLLLMAHPRAQPAETLVDLDAWVRGGGRLLLLADPKLVWPSRRPLGDKLRPPPSFADTGLLQHWGLTLFAPAKDGVVTARVDGRSIELLSPGSLEGDCAIRAHGLIARCEVGRGEVTVIADADFLDVVEADSANLHWLLAELGRLER